MEYSDLDKLSELVKSATPGPWYVRQLDDEMLINAIVVSTKQDTYQSEDMRSGNWPGEEIVAACLILNPPYAIINDDKHEENAKMIAALRNSIEELIDLAKIGIIHRVLR